MVFPFDVGARRRQAWVASESDRHMAYRVDLDAGECNCPAARYRPFETCKHLLAARLYWDRLAVIEGLR